MADRNQLAKPIDQGFISRVASGVKYIFTGKLDWFGPGEPMPPVVPDQVAAGTEGRAWDYPVAVNKTTLPRQNEAVQYSQMRALADSLDILRLAIETRKDQLTKLEHKIKPVEGASVPEARLKKLNDCFKRPDRELRWRTWLRKLLEDYYVIDAVTIWPRRTRGGEIYSLDLLDGATIKRNVDILGRTPDPPAPAYQQVLKGVVAAEYARGALIYRPHNVRTHKLYGYSHVEQIVMIVNIALRRQLGQLNYFTEGNVPDALGTVPEGWQPSQIKEFQAYWDAMNEGVLEAKRKMKWVPHGMNYIPTKGEILKNEFDEWLARIICYAFSLPPTAFIKAMNRATAEQQQDAAIQEGLLTDMGWIKDLMDDILEMYFDAADCEWVWEQEKSVDPKVQAEVDEIYVNTGVQQPEQIAEARGFDFIEPSEPPKPALPVLPAPGAPAETGAGVEAPEATKAAPQAPQDAAHASAEKLLKTAKAKPKGRRLEPIPFDRAPVRKAKKALQKLLDGFWREEAGRIAGELSGSLALEKAAGEKTPDQAIDDLDFSDWKLLFDPIAEQLEQIYEDTGLQALLQLGLTEEGITDLVHEGAVEFARERAAELVGMKYVDGELVENPDPKWAITDSTREMLRDVVTQSLEEGPSSQALAKAIEESAAFAPERAEMVARTELAFAHSEGALDGYRSAREAGITVLKEWLTADGEVEDECAENADAGPIPLDEAFPSGHDAAPAHPNCECSVAPYVVEVEEGDEPYK